MKIINNIKPFNINEKYEKNDKFIYNGKIAITKKIARKETSNFDCHKCIFIKGECCEKDELDCTTNNIYFIYENNK